MGSILISEAGLTDKPDDRWRSWELWLILLIAAYFIFRLFYFAIMIGPNIPPDEITHVGLIQLYSQEPMFIDNSPESYQYGLVTNVPYLYHFLLGKLLKLNVFGLDSYLFLRILNIILACFTLYLSYRLVTLLTENSMIKILFMVMLTNTLMFSFISFSINYDNLVNLCSVISVYCLFSYFKKKEIRSLLIFFIFILAGSLTKISFLPLGLILMAIYLFHQRLDITKDLKSVWQYFSSPKLNTVIIGILLLISVTASLHLYGGNIFRYGKIVPSCSQVLGDETCMQNRIYARERILSEYRSGKITYEDAIQKTNIIKLAGDRDHALRLLQNERNYKIRKPQTINRWDYVQLVVKNAIKPTVFGIQAHRSMLKSSNALIPYSILFLLAFILWIRYVKFDESHQLWNYLALIFGGYVMYLIGFYNYSLYKSSHALYSGVQGRYIFPVIIPLFLVVAKFLIKPFRKHLRVIVFSLACIIFVWGDFPYFLKHVTDAWYKKIDIQASYNKKISNVSDRKFLAEKWRDNADSQD